MIVLYILCVLSALAIAAGAFYWGRHIASVELTHKRLEEDYNKAIEHIQTVEEALEEVSRENEYMHKEMTSQGSKVSAPRKWNPADPLNSSERM